MEQILSVIGFFGLVFGIIFILVAGTSSFPAYRHNTTLYTSGIISGVSGFCLLLFF